MDAVVRPPTDFSRAELFEGQAGGAGTTPGTVRASAFSHPSANLGPARQFDFKVGDGIFRKLWVSAPSSTISSDGLGPLFNARSCQSCHLRDGRGRPPAPDEPAVSLLLRLSVPPRDEAERTALAAGRLTAIPEPTYGDQLQTFSVQGIAAEGRLTIAYSEVPAVLGDGSLVSLRSPSYSIADAAYGDLRPDTLISPRIAPPMIGVGLLEAIAEADVRAAADPDDADGDGVSGRPNEVWSALHRRPMLGRFGWKAGQPTVPDQTAAAFAGDMGISSPAVPVAWGDCTASQTACREAPHGSDAAEGVEATGVLFDLVVFYARNLGVPARRDVADPQVLTGKRVFHDTGCPACHRPTFVTARDSAEPEQSLQLIWPYTDLLLHDMGEGLADHRPEGQASGREWRTPPLWGLGLTRAVSGHGNLLHDGRARTPLEAILWHGGEAQAARDRVAAMPEAERAALLAFLDSL